MTATRRRGGPTREKIHFTALTLLLCVGAITACAKLGELGEPNWNEEQRPRNHSSTPPTEPEEENEADPYLLLPWAYPWEANTEDRAGAANQDDPPPPREESESRLAALNTTDPEHATNLPPATSTNLGLSNHKRNPTPTWPRSTPPTLSSPRIHLQRAVTTTPARRSETRTAQRNKEIRHLDPPGYGTRQWRQWNWKLRNSSSPAAPGHQRHQRTTRRIQLT
jgi:hypothetical protein